MGLEGVPAEVGCWDEVIQLWERIDEGIDNGVHRRCGQGNEVFGWYPVAVLGTRWGSGLGQEEGVMRVFS